LILYPDQIMITIIDYQMGNLRSVQKAFEHLGVQATITSDPSAVANAEKLVLPGVGAFEDAMAELRARGLVEPIRNYVAQDRPFLGICLGLQLLFDVSYEGGKHTGLGIVPGEVRRFELPHEFKVPHMGWNRGHFLRPCPLLDGIADGSHFYFVHSYYVVPNDKNVVVIETDYGGPFCAMIQRGNLFATQFHPEKSQRDGLRILENFSRL
jgi:glutamine amidotransferase